MAIDRMLFQSDIQEKYCPQWPCPTCPSGALKIKEGSIQFSETFISRKESHSFDWEPEWTREIFVGMLVCQNEECREVCTVSGVTSNDFSVYEGRNGEPVQELTKTFHPRFFNPPIPIFRVSQKVPDKIRVTIFQSFSLYWVDHLACANRIRSVIEQILNNRKVKRYSVGKNGKRIPLALHHRIDLFEKKEEQIAKSLMAIKFIGNEGSHDGSINKFDLLDAYDILCHCLEEIYDERTRAIQILRERIRRQRGPLSNIRTRNRN